MNVLAGRRFPARATRVQRGAVLIVFGTTGSGQVPSSVPGWNALLQAHVRGIDDGHALYSAMPACAVTERSWRPTAGRRVRSWDTVRLNRLAMR